MEALNDAVVGLIYDAAVEPKNWPKLLNELLNIANGSDGSVALAASLAPHFERAESLAKHLHLSDQKKSNFINPWLICCQCPP